MMHDVKADKSEVDYTRHYGRWHDDSDEHWEVMASSFRTLLSPYLPEDKASEILEVGSGMGFAIFSLMQLGYKNVIGIDADRGQVAAAQRKHLPVEHVPVSETLNFLATKAGKFDFMFCTDVLEHIPVNQQIEFLRSVRECLRPGARFLCRVPNANSAVASRYRYVDWTHHCSFTETSLDFVLFSAGFDDIRVSEADPFRPPRYPWIPSPALALYLLRLFFRGWRRLEMIAWMGKQAMHLPLTKNILGVAHRPK